MKFARALLLAAIGALLIAPAAANAAAITPQPNASTLGSDLLANNLLLNAGQTTFTERPNVSSGPSTPAPTSGQITAPLLGFPTGPGNGIVLSTGDIVDIENANQGNQFDSSFYDPTQPHGSVTHDVTTLKVAVNVPNNTCAAFDYRFLSEEFPNYVGSSFNDAFIAGVDFNDWTDTDPYVINRPHDVAADPAGKPVSVNGVGPTAMLPTEAVGTIFNASTGLVTTKFPVTPGPHDFYFSIFDASDHIYDSAVFIDNLRFFDEGPATCTPPLAQDLAPPATPPSNSFTVTTGSSVTFGKGTATISMTIPAPGVVSVADGSSAATASASRSVTASKKKKYKPLIKPLTASFATAGPIKLKLKLTSAGLKKLNKTGKVKVKLAITFTPTGGTAASQFKTITIKKAKKKKKHH